MPLGQVLYESGGTLSYGYFPTTAIVSLMYVTESGASSEIAVVGNDGIVGVRCSWVAARHPAGRWYRALARAFACAGERFGRVLALGFGDDAVAALHPGPHRADGTNRRLQPAPFGGPATVPLLLLSLDRLPGNELVVTQELIAHMLGVRREGVTQAAVACQKAGLIRYRRGRITVVDRPGLERRSCECYASSRRSTTG